MEFGNVPIADFQIFRLPPFSVKVTASDSRIGWASTTLSVDLCFDRMPLKLGCPKSLSDQEHAPNPIARTAVSEATGYTWTNMSAPIPHK
jgi:hypothetical protein